MGLYSRVYSKKELKNETFVELTVFNCPYFSQFSFRVKELQCNKAETFRAFK